LELARKIRDLAMFNLGIDSKLRGCDLVALKVSDVAKGGEILERTSIIQKKTKRPVKYEISKATRVALEKWISRKKLKCDDYLFPSSCKNSPHIGVRQYARIVKRWARLCGKEDSAYGTHSMRRTKPTIIYRETKNIRAVQILLGHTKLDSTIRYLGIEEEDALGMAEKIEI